MNARLLIPLLLCALPGTAPANVVDGVLGSMDDALRYQSQDGRLYAQLSGEVDLWGALADQKEGGPWGFWFPKDDNDFQFYQRLTLLTDVYWEDWLYLFSRVRWDDGVHPGVARFYGPSRQVRADELFVRFAFGEERRNFLQVGEFTPRFTSFLSRSDPWSASLVTYPVAFEGVTSVGDQYPGESVAEFAARRDRPDNRLKWVPVVWCPLYSQNVSFFGSGGPFEYAVTLSNSAPSSRGTAWNDSNFTHPSLLLRGVWKPSEDWHFGVSASAGSYLQETAEEYLPPGKGRNDYQQQLLGLDVTYQHRHFSLWAEGFFSRFQVPYSGNADVFSYYIETRYDISTQWWLSARWNQEMYNTIDGQQWDNPVYRMEGGIGWSVSRHIRAKLQYSYQHQDATFQNGTHFWVTEWSARW